MSNAEQQPRGVVVGVDGSEHGFAAARYGATEAHRLGVSLDLVHVLPASIPVATEHEPMVSNASLQSYGTEILACARKVVLGVLPDLEVRTWLRSGNRSHELLVCAEQAHLLVLGNRSPSAFDRIWTGGTVTAVAGGAGCPVIVVPAEWHQDVARGRVAVGVKTPGEGHEMLEAAFVRARDLDADLVVLHAWRLEGVYDDIIADRTCADRWQEAQTALIQRDLEDLRERYPAVPLRIYVRHEDPAHALVRVTHGVDRLLVQRPTTGRPRHDLGRVGRAILRDAHCPVEVVPTHRGAHVLTPEGQLEAVT